MSNYFDYLFILVILFCWSVGMVPEMMPYCMKHVFEVCSEFFAFDLWTIFCLLKLFNI